MKKSNVWIKKPKLRKTLTRREVRKTYIYIMNSMMKGYRSSHDRQEINSQQFWDGCLDDMESEVDVI